VIKPFWSPLVDLLGTRRRWIWLLQLAIGFALFGVAVAIPQPQRLTWTLVLFWFMAFSSATHDIAADGFYMLGTDERQQSLFIGVRNTFYRAAVLAGQGPLVLLAGAIEKRSGTAQAWTTAMLLLAVLFFAFGLWHAWVLPRPASDRPGKVSQFPAFVREFFATFGSFFRKPGIVPAVAFILLYRLGEAQLVKMVAPFLLDPRTRGGLGLTTSQFGLIYGTFGVLALTLGGIAGGVVAARDGLKKWLWPMLLAIHVPDAVFIFLAYAQPTNPWIVQVAVILEQFGYGFGFTALLLYMMRVARGEHRTAHYAICTGFMAMGLMFPGMWSGWLEDHIGYRHFFVWVILATVPSFLVGMRLPLDDEFGKKQPSG
jgi:PAT family beta-lactamase induction signal transducer AmpG